MAPILFVLFIIVPIIELAIIIQVGQLVGTGWTIVALVAMSLIGAALVKAEGLRAWRRFREAVAEARMPAAEVLDGALVLLGGALMLTPGFMTDGLGLLLVMPPTRGVVNRAVRGRVRGVFGLPRPGRSEAGRPSQDRRRPQTRAGDAVVDVEVVRVERDDVGRDRE